MRRTKIIATLGPASDSEGVIEQLIDAGVDVFRFNMKHNLPQWHSHRMQLIEKICQRKKVRVGMLLDLQGPEVRISNLVKEVSVSRGETVVFCVPGEKGIPLDHPSVFGQIETGQKVYIDDGLMEFLVTGVEKDKIKATVVEGGLVKDRKTVNFPGAKLSFPTLIERDLENLSLAARHEVDFVALSFVRSVDNIMVLKQEMGKQGIKARIIAKIEHPEAVEHFDEILLASDGIMVARGDLGIEYPIEEVPHLQKTMVKKAREEGRVVIIATQMLETMVENTRPTRAEVSDVANAVYDSADAIMLSAESASGKNPVRAVETMARIAARVDGLATPQQVTVDWKEGGEESMVIGSAVELLRLCSEGNVDISAILLVTNSPGTVQLLSRLRPRVPIIVASGEEFVLDHLSLSWGVLPLHTASRKMSEVIPLLQQNSLTENYVTAGKRIIVLTPGQHAAVSTIRLIHL